MGQVRIGANCWNQWTPWPALLEAGIRADRLGYDFATEVRPLLERL
jgi:hypothetical protein